jgi:phosphoglycerate dehydrogenase-like enzyme
MKIVIALPHRFSLWQAPPWFIERLKSQFPQLLFVEVKDYMGLPVQLKDADVFVGWSLRPEQLTLAPKLLWIHSPAAAVHQLMFPLLIKSKIMVTNSSEVHGPVVAEHVMALILAMARRLEMAFWYQQQKVWGQEKIWSERPRPMEVAGSNLLVVGLGNIGREVVQRAKAIGMHAIGIREHPEKGNEGCEAVFSPSHVDTIIGDMDFVVLSAPLTESTRGLINAARLSRMKRSAYLINVSRGPLIDDSALVATLRAKKIGGAALDVFEEEPLPPNSPYWALDNCLVSPHIAALTENLWERHYALFADNLHRFMTGKELRGMVDKQRGY